MLNYSAFQVLGDHDTISDAALRLFIRLMRDYDLSCYRVISLRHMSRLYRISQREILVILQELTRSELLELGPKMHQGQMYRVGRQFLFAQEDAANWFHTLETLDGLRALAPSR